MTGRQRHAAVRAAFERWTETWSPALGRHRGLCGLCGCPDARHRVADTMVSRYEAGDPLQLIAYDFDVEQPHLAELVAAGLAYRVAHRRARLPQDWQPGTDPNAIAAQLEAAR